MILPLRHQDLSRITIEDVFITGDLAEKCSVARVHHPGFVYNINLKRSDVVSHLSEAVARCAAHGEGARFSRAGGRFCGTT